MIPERAALLLRLSKSVESSRRSIGIICSWKTCVHALFDLLPLYRRALDRGVKIRWVVYKPLDQEAMPENIEELLESSLFEFRFLPCNQEERLAIYDAKEVYVASYPERGYIESPALWSNAVPLIKLVQNYFDMLWNKTAGASLGK
jgi:hypothetical protein